MLKVATTLSLKNPRAAAYPVGLEKLQFLELTIFLWLVIIFKSFHLPMNEVEEKAMIADEKINFKKFQCRM